MRSIRTLSCALAVFALLAVPTVHAQEAPTPGEIVRSCVDSMQQITQHAANGQKQVAMATVNRLETLAEEGAPNAQLFAVAHRGVHKIGEITGTAREALNTSSRRCARALDEIKAPHVFKDALHAAHHAAGERLRRTNELCSRFILDALRDLIGEDENAAA